MEGLTIYIAILILATILLEMSVFGFIMCLKELLIDDEDAD